MRATTAQIPDPIEGLESLGQRLGPADEFSASAQFAGLTPWDKLLLEERPQTVHGERMVLLHSLRNEMAQTSYVGLVDAMVTDLDYVVGHEAPEAEAPADPSAIIEEVKAAATPEACLGKLALGLEAVADRLWNEKAREELTVLAQASRDAAVRGGDLGTIWLQQLGEDEEPARTRTVRLAPEGGTLEGELSLPTIRLYEGLLRMTSANLYEYYIYEDLPDSMALFNGNWRGEEIAIVQTRRLITIDGPNSGVVLTDVQLMTQKAAKEQISEDVSKFMFGSHESLSGRKGLFYALGDAVAAMVERTGMGEPAPHRLPVIEEDGNVDLHRAAYPMHATGPGKTIEVTVVEDDALIRR